MSLGRAVDGDQQSEQALKQNTQQLMSERNRTLDKQLNYGLCDATELVRRIPSVLGSPCFEGK